jgi:pilus assembly protein Flp/PilA
LTLISNELSLERPEDSLLNDLQPSPVLLSKPAIDSGTPDWAELALDDSGQDLIEYALVAALIALGAVSAMRSLGTSISSAFGDIATKLTTDT